jgi:hypothetical protein
MKATNELAEESPELASANGSGRNGAVESVALSYNRRTRQAWPAQSGPKNGSSLTSFGSTRRITRLATSGTMQLQSKQSYSLLSGWLNT